MPSKKSTSKKRVFPLLPLLAILIISLIGGAFYVISARVNERTLEQASRPVSADLYASLKTEGLIPITRPAAHEVGSVFRTTSGEWYQKSSVCFPTLPASTTSQSALPTIILHSVNGIGLALGFDKIVNTKTSTQTAYQMSIMYSDVVVFEVPESDLLKAFDRSACPELISQIDSIMTGTPPDEKGRQFLIVRQLYKARRAMEIQVETRAGASELLGMLKSALEINGEVQVSSSGSAKVVLDNSAVLPVAARPAFILAPTTSTLGPNKASDPTSIWMPFSPSENPGDIAYFQELMNPTVNAWTQKNM